ncbi:ADP-ribose pyrophosphatase [Halorubrum californiense DSM 19288]|uniref:ADP-ribose pyrophosphatase n=1 Tax=Halorubrum californiense DSM 19288 TaxID=1227465 RepID=M0DUJ8_9EURY|nr:NUDIX hydrolase [Halorubrum californiense]ELZ39190.1 ADP-ribose pyrophosphatase [Halorubrum californiense DSM 19288]
MTDTPLRATVTQRGVVVTPDEHVLIVQRASDGAWELPGGRLDRSEDATVGLVRELREETSLNPEVVEPVDTVTWVNDDGNGRFAVYYYCRGSRRTVSLSPEHDAAAWQPARAAAERLSDPQTAAVEAAVTHHRRAVDRGVAAAPSSSREHGERS